MGITNSKEQDKKPSPSPSNHSTRPRMTSLQQQKPPTVSSLPQDRKENKKNFMEFDLTPSTNALQNNTQAVLRAVALRQQESKRANERHQKTIISNNIRVSVNVSQSPKAQPLPLTTNFQRDNPVPNQGSINTHIENMQKCNDIQYEVAFRQIEPYIIKQIWPCWLISESLHLSDLRQAYQVNYDIFPLNYCKDQKLVMTFWNPWSQTPIQLKRGDKIEMEFLFFEIQYIQQVTARVIQIFDNVVYCQYTNSKSSDRELLENMYENYYYPRVIATYSFNDISFKNNDKCIQELHAWKQNKLVSELLDPTTITSSIQQLSSYHIQQIKRNQYRKNLNSTQRKALNLALNNRISVIQGPPGTGKSTLIAEIVAHLQHLLRISQHIMVCAPSNVATDGLSVKISQRIGDQHVLRAAGEFQTMNYFNEGIKELQKISFKGKEKKFGYKTSKKAVQKSHVICSTLQSSVSDRLSRFEFPYVIIDEATQCCQPQCLLPLFKGAKRIILVGDHKQLGPVIKSDQSITLGYGKSLFQRLIQAPQVKSHCSIMLDTQYRMDPRISLHSNRLFYNNQIKDGTIQNKGIRHPFVFYDVPNGQQKKFSKDPSWRNQMEAKVVISIIEMILKKKMFKAEDIGVITPYIGQKNYLLSLKASRKQFDAVEINSIDSYQGREKEVIIMTTVRSGESVGFVGNTRRINVAISRPKKKIIIVGNKSCLISDPTWNKIVG